MITAWFLLFLSAFGAATIFPFYSEIAVVGMITAKQSPLLVFLVATTGNTLGSVVNWFIGRLIIRGTGQKYSKKYQSQIEKAQVRFRKYGVWSLLLAWLPIGGDAITVVAGMAEVKMRVFIPLVAVGKGIRYAVVILGALAATN